MTQITPSVNDTSDTTDALRQRFPKIVGPRKNDIRYVTINRQEAICVLAEQVGIALVVGSENSSNFNCLVELAQRIGKATYLVDDAADIRKVWVKETRCVGMTAGAPAPGTLV